jgi:hypothetical protein
LEWVGNSNNKNNKGIKMTDRADMSESEKKKEDWMNNKWRPMMGWMYMLVCTCDFVLFPVLWGVLQTVGGGKVETQWMPITLQGAGLFHMAMGAILGIAAFGRTQEKLAGANNGGITPPTMPSPIPVASAPMPAPVAPKPMPAPVAAPVPKPVMPPAMDDLPDDPPARNSRND